MLLGCGEKSIRFRSPLNITKDEIDRGMDRIEDAIRRVEKEYRPFTEEAGLQDALTDG